jgi:hypothetical protein
MPQETLPRPSQPLPTDLGLISLTTLYKELPILALAFNKPI